MEEVSIVILNWNGKSFIEKYLPILLKFSQNTRIIIADNNSTDDSISYVKKNYPEVECILLNKNFGFAQGYNIALEKVKSKYYLLINSDIEVTEYWLEPLIKCIEKEDIACCQPKILSLINKEKFEHAGASGGFLDKDFFPFCRGRIFNSTEQDNGQYDDSKEVFWASGACLLIKSELFHLIGGFDDLFFAHMEEIDLCWRLKLLGYKVYVEPKSVVYHVGGGTLTYMSPFKTFLNFRNSLYMISKNYTGILFFKIFYRMCLDAIASFLFLYQGNIKHFFAVIKAHFSFYKNLSKILSKRRVIQNNKNNFNKIGLYKGSILKAFYIKKIKLYSNLNQKLFN